jgi:putative transcriptional regulator
MAFKTRIKELRARYDLTQDDLAKKVGVRRETILCLEKGKCNPSLELAHRIAQTLNTTIEDVFIFENKATTTDSAPFKKEVMRMDIKVLDIVIIAIGAIIGVTAFVEGVLTGLSLVMNITYLIRKRKN